MKPIRFTNQAVAEMLKGEHSSQQKKQFSMFVTDAERKRLDEQNKPRAVGDTWEELDEEGDVKYIWTQHSGYRTKADPNAIDYTHPSWDKYVYPKCEENCETQKRKEYTRLDEKYRKIYGMCTDCAAKFETRMKIRGEWPAFEKAKMLANARSFFNEADDAVKEVAARLEKVDFVKNESGQVETWEGDPEKSKALMEEYNTYKTLILETLEGKRNDVVV